MARKYLISYSKDWSRKTLNIPKIKSLRKQAEELKVKIKTHDEVFTNEDILKQVLDVSENGFEDIVSREKIKSIENFPYSQAMSWILNNPNKNLISIMMIISEEESDKVWRIERNLDGVRYYMGLLKSK